MEVLLLTDIAGIGKRNDLLVVASGFALNHLLPERKAIVATPNVRKQFAEKIRARAMEREQERKLQESLSSTLAGKVVHVEAKTAKAGKLYAAIDSDAIAAALRDEYGIALPSSSISSKEPIKTVGTHSVTISIGAQSTSVIVDVKGVAEKKKTAVKVG